MRFAVVCFGDKSVRQWNCISFPNFRKYCSLHSYGFFAYDIVADKTRPSAWSKIKYVLAHLQDYDWVMWIDSDCVIEQPQITLDKFTSDKDIIFCIGGKHGDINTGVFLAKNSSWTKNFLLNVYQQTFLVNDKTFLLPRSFSDYKRRRKCNCNGCKYYKYEQKSFIHLLHSMQKDELEQHIEIRNPQSQNLCFQSYHDEYWDGCFIRHFPGNKEKKNYREFVQSAIVSWEKMKGGNEGATLPEYLTVKEKKLVRKAMSKDYVLAKLKLKERTNRLLHKIFGGLK